MELIRSEVRLTIGMLVSNSISTVKKCMESLKPILEQVKSELIIIDTGGTDGAIEICREYTDKIYPFTWCNDFSAARNECLKHASGEWFMFLDDDEWFENTDELIEFFNGSQARRFRSGIYAVRNYTSYAGTSYIEGLLGRIVRRYDITHFEGAVHEVLVPFGTPAKYFDRERTYIHHYGYVYEKDNKEKKGKRNIPLLKSELEKNPKESRLYGQLIQEYAAVGSYDEGIAVAQDLYGRINILSHSKEYVWCLAMIPRLLLEKKEYGKALEMVETLNSKLEESNIKKILLSSVYLTAINKIWPAKSGDKSKDMDTAAGIRSCDIEKAPEYAKMYFEITGKIDENKQLVKDISCFDTTRFYNEEEREALEKIAGLFI